MFLISRNLRGKSDVGIEKKIWNEQEKSPDSTSSN